jgi:hypothetical protein
MQFESQRASACGVMDAGMPVIETQTDPAPCLQMSLRKKQPHLRQKRSLD